MAGSDRPWPSCLALTLTLFSSSYPEQERWGGYAAFTDKICGDEVQIFGDFYYDDVKQHDELAPIATGSFNTEGQPTLAIPPHSDLNGVAPPNTPRFAGQPQLTGTGVPVRCRRPPRSMPSIRLIRSIRLFRWHPGPYLRFRQSFDRYRERGLAGNGRSQRRQGVW